MPKRIEYEVIGIADEVHLQKLRDEESARINNLVVGFDQLWWSSKVIQDESAALLDGTLMNVPDVGENYGLRWGLIQNQEPKTIRPRAFLLLLEIQTRWQQLMQAQNEDLTHICFAVISLYRSLELQERERQGNPLASQGFSAHTAGAAIDLDPNGYYIGEGRDKMQANMEGYREIYSITLMNVLKRLVDEGACQVIWEKSLRIEDELLIRYTACYHVCVSPNFMPRYDFAE